MSIGRTLTLLYGIVCYAIFLATFVYAIGFVGNLFVPKGIDSQPQTPFGLALLVDLVLLTIFAVQHSVMARPAFKKWWTRIVPEAMERSTYTLFASLALLNLFVFWEPLGGTIWQVENPALATVLQMASLLGWGLVLLSTFLINHFDLFGLRQVWLHFRNKPYTPVRFATPGPYKFVRHPLYLGFICAFWFTPTMTVTHLLFAVVTTVYILVAIQLEEHDLITALGEDYRAYRNRVPMLLPVGKSQPKPVDRAVD